MPGTKKRGEPMDLKKSVADTMGSKVGHGRGCQLKAQFSHSSLKRCALNPFLYKKFSSKKNDDRDFQGAKTAG